MPLSSVRVVDHRRVLRSSIETADGYIAATALAYGFSVATRDTSPFLAAGAKVVNPWDVLEA